MEVFGANGVERTSGVVLPELYRGVKCEVRVEEYLSEPFEVWRS